MSRLPAYEEAFDEDEEEEIGDTEEGEIIARLQASQQNKLYEDASFPAKRTSLYRWVIGEAFGSGRGNVVMSFFTVALHQPHRWVSLVVWQELLSSYSIRLASRLRSRFRYSVCIVDSDYV